MRRAAVQALRTTTRRSNAVRRALSHSYPHLRHGSSRSGGGSGALINTNSSSSSSALTRTPSSSSTAFPSNLRPFSQSSSLAIRSRASATGRSASNIGNQQQQLLRSAWQQFLRLNSPPSQQHVRILESSILFKQFTTFLAGLLFAGGAYWALNPSDSAASSSLVRPHSNGPFAEGQAATNSSLTSLGQQLVNSSDRAAGSGVAAATAAAEAAIAESTRRALVVENDQFFAGDIQGDEPLSKTVDASGRLVVEMLTPEQATEKLRKHEQSYLIGRGQGVVRYDVTQLPSNNPIEDDHAEKIVEHTDSAGTNQTADKSDWMFWGVFDGHSGWTTSAKLRQVLISFVTRELSTVYSSAASSGSASLLPTPEAIDAAIKHGFVKLDHEIVHESVNKLQKNGTKRAAAELLAPALSGSCALLSFYDSKSRLLRVACTGDSRAVLGRRSDNGKWVATALSEDLTGGTPSEEARLRKEHPGEEFVVRNGRILGGLEPSRAFGDAIYKWSAETQRTIKSHWLGRSGSPLLKTPPYVTAEPVVTTTQIQPEKGDFVVMATDGLWECLTNEEVVGLVGRWIEQNARSKPADGGGSGLLSNLFGGGSGGSKKALPVENHSASRTSSDGSLVDGQRAPIRQQQYQIKQGDERFVVEDQNAATHLVRNALGGRDRDMFCALLTLPAPFSRRYRDDLTVEVIFFGDGERSGDIVQNVEATNMGAGEKAKL